MMMVLLIQISIIISFLFCLDDLDISSEEEEEQIEENDDDGIIDTKNISAL